MPFGLTEERYKKIKSVFSRFPMVEEVLIFGSRSMDTYKPASDIDLALIGEKITHADVIKIGMALDELPYGYTFDIIDYKKNTHKEFKKHIDKYGVSFYKKEQVKKGWKKYKLKDLINVKHGFAFKGEFFSDKPTKNILLSPGNFKIGGGFKTDKFKYYEGEYPQEYTLKGGDILITMTDLSKAGDTLGYSAKIPVHSGIHYLHNQRLGLVEFKTNDFDREFLYWLLRTNQYQNYIVGSASGSTVKHTSPTRICDYEFYAPSDEKQQHNIASVLSSLDNKIELNLQMNKTLENMAQAIFKEWFVEFKVNGKKLKTDNKAGLPTGWKKDSIYEIIDVVYGFPFQSKLFNERKEGKGLIRIRDLKNNNTGFYTTESADNKYLVHAGDILAGMDAEFVPSVWYGEPAWLNQRVCKFKPKDNSVHELFILFSIKPLLEKSQYGKVGTTVIHLGKSDIDRYEIIIPSKEVLKMASSILRPIHNRLIEIEIENRILSETRDNLLPKLMTGKIEVKA